MPKSFEEWLVETSSTTGTGAYSLSGSQPAGTSYFKFRDRFSNGESIVYYVVSADRSKWEKNVLGTLTYGSPDTLSRNVVKSTNGDAPVSWVGGDLPLRVYVGPDSDVDDGAVTGWLAAARHALLRFGSWFKQDDPSSGKHSWKIFDGTSDIQVGIVDTGNHTIAMACMPAGIVVPYAGAAAPGGFLLCDGSAVSRTTYAVLFAVIGTTFGVGDGSTTFNLPDLRGRVVAGQDDMGGSSANRLTSPLNGDTLGAASGFELVNSTAPTPGGALVTNSASDVAVSPDGHAHQSSTIQPTIVLNYIIGTGGVT